MQEEIGANPHSRVGFQQETGQSGWEAAGEGLKALEHAEMQKRTGAIAVSLLACALVLFAALATLSGCSPAPAKSTATDALADYAVSDMSGYSCAQGYEGEYRFVDMTVRDISSQMDAGNSFVVFAGYENCPWCNVLLNYLNDAATECGVRVGYLDTRRNPEWKTNMDIDDYDLLVQLFGEYLSVDDSGNKRLYVPMVFFVKDGKAYAAHAGTLPEQESPTDPLTPAQQQALKQELVDSISQLL